MGDKKNLWDPVRKKWLLNTPEEEIRQKIILYLTKVIKIPSSLIEIEHQLKKRNLPHSLKRCDIVAWKKSNHDGLLPWLIVECKSPTIKISPQDFYTQLNQYSQYYPADYLMLSNGRQTFYWKKSSASYELTSSLTEHPQ